MDSSAFGILWRPMNFALLKLHDIAGMAPGYLMERIITARVNTSVIIMVTI